MPEQIDPFEGAPELPRIVAVSFLAVGHLYNFLAGGLTLRRGDRVVVRTKAGEVMAKELKRRTAKSIELKSLNKEHAARTRPVSEVLWVARILWASQ